MRELILLLLVALVLWAQVANPFGQFSSVISFYDVVVDKSSHQLELTKLHAPRVITSPAVSLAASAISGVRIVTNAIVGGKKAQGETLEQIIDEIHRLRFDPKNLYLISGDHFVELYPRSLGIFYASLLDPRTVRSGEDWTNRQSIYLKTTAIVLDTLTQTHTFPTTIAPLGKNFMTSFNVYAPASDTVFSVLYALRVLATSEDILRTYPFPSSSSVKLQTQQAATKLLFDHAKDLTDLVHAYKAMVFDEQTGLVKRDIHLSGTKDGEIRENAFYDNVIFWKTMQLTQELHLLPQDEEWLQRLKSRILTAFWLPDEGYFLDDLSDQSVKEKWYSSDWLIVLETQFLDPTNPDELGYFEKSVQYIQKHKLDVPFGLAYQGDDRIHRQYWVPRIFAPDYNGKNLWSNWGMEYVKLLGLLSQTTHNVLYLDEAKKQLASYEKNILMYQGYPEVYDATGAMYKKLFYQSVRQTGWVVSFEQARALITSLNNLNSSAK